MDEAEISKTFEQISEAQSLIRHFFMRHPVTAFRLLSGLTRLEMAQARPTESPSGQFLRAGLPKNRKLLQPFSHRSVLPIPTQPNEYSAGARRQTLRRKTRKALSDGVTWAVVTNETERRRVFDEAQIWESSKVEKNARPEENADLFLYDHWLVAYSSDGNPIMLSVTPIDDKWAVLRYFRVIGTGDAQSNVRYLMMQALVEQLSELHVSYLLDPVPPHELPNGQRHFQRMVGFSIHRVSALADNR